MSPELYVCRISVKTCPGNLHFDGINIFSLYVIRKWNPLQYNMHSRKKDMIYEFNFSLISYNLHK